TKLSRFLPPRGWLCRPHLERREAGRFAGPSPEQIRIGDKPKDSQRIRANCPELVAAPRRRGDRMIAKMRRREFITLLGGAAAVGPLAARAQQGERMRRIGVLMNLTADDPEASARVTALAQGLQQLGWTVGRNLQIDYRWGAVDTDRSRRYAAELVALAPDVILAVGSTAVAALQQGAVP